MSSIKGRSANMNFLFGSVFFFFVIIVTIGLFSYVSLYKYWNKPGDKRFSYEISFSPAFAGKAYSVYMNDSLLYTGVPVDCDTVLRVNRFAEENALLVVNVVTDGVSILQLPDRGRVLLRMSADGGITADVKD
ncbi:MAG: hypothetical protein IJZ22_05895 [Bacteroidaceae bacterium]|nr:hypothetical protein [Bacteroidaceae bacterium]